MTFTGWPAEAFTFYERLEADNSKGFWTANKEVYDEAVRGPLDELLAELADGYGTFHVFRPHRDVRFSKDKSPYKTHLGAVTEGEGGEVYYLQLSATGLFTATGYHQMARDQLERYYAAVADERTGPALERALGKIGRSYEIGGQELKTAPRGYPKDHPRVELLRHKGLTIGRSFGRPAWLSTRRAKSRITESWRHGAPVYQWLNAHVGPSREAPDDAR